MFEISEIRILAKRVVIFDHETNVKFISPKKFYYPLIVLARDVLSLCTERMERN